MNTLARSLPPAWRNQALRVRWLLRKAAARTFDPNIRNLTGRLQMLQGKYAGQRCFIMGNGPSLNQMDLRLFAGENVWASNKAYLLFDRISWRPNFYTSIDLRVVPDIAGELLRLSQQLPETRFFIPLHFRYDRVLPSRPNIYWFNEVPQQRASLPEGMFSLDVSRAVVSAATVTVSALQMAAYLGFNPIYLIGCDTSYSVPPTVKYEQGNQNLIVSTQNDDPNHFASDYFGQGSRWHAPHVENMLFHYEQSARICQQAGISVYNATVGGQLEAFPRVNYLDLF